MVTLFQPEFQNNLLGLGKLSVDFWQRMLLLSAHATESFGNRLYRLQSNCAGQALNGLLGEQREAADCGQAYLEEVRNSEQVALMTYEEMQVWLDSFAHQWQKLSGASAN